MERKIKLQTLNSHIICKICGGYLIDATTVTECLHTFCKSCLVKFLEDNTTCPSCKITIHQSHPLQYISFDRTMQDIVYKLVPNLQENEAKRVKEFYQTQGVPCPKDLLTNNEHVSANKPIDEDVNDVDFHRFDEQVNICLECGAKQYTPLQRRFLRCSSQATVTHLKKFIALKVLNSIDAYRDVDILCNDELLGKDHTLKFVILTRWRFKQAPLTLVYRPRVDLM